MARVTVEDCILNVPNRFELVILAAQRAKQISSGNPLTIDRDNDKDAVVALREIAEKTVSTASLNESAILVFSKHQAPEPQEKEETAAAESVPAHIEEAFEDAKQNIALLNKGVPDAPLSFEDDNIDVED